MMTLGLKASLSGCLTALVCGGSALAGPDPYMGEIISVGENFCPRGYLPAAGQLIPIQQNTALFSLLGCTYGGDCRTTFGIPDLRGRDMIGAGAGPGLPPYTRGEMGGATMTMIAASEMPIHTHDLVGSTNSGNSRSPDGRALPTYPNPTAEAYANQPPGSAPLLSTAVGHAGLGEPLSITQPTIAINYCIASVGIFPPRP
jgi:microcystin-dependent protein